MIQIKWTSIFVFIPICFSSVFASAEIFELKLSSESFKKQEVGKKGEGSFQKLKELENQKKWESCSRSSKKVFDQNKSMQGWVGTVWLHCARKQLEETKNPKELQSALSFLEKRGGSGFFGITQKVAFLNELVKGQLQLVEFLSASGYLEKKENQKEFAKTLNSLFENSDILSKEQKAKVYFYFSELAQAEHNLKGALQFLDLSLSEKELKMSREKYNNILLALGETTSEIKNGQKETLISEVEQKAELNLDSFQKNNDHLSYLDEGVHYLNRFPNGRRSRQVQEKVLEIYSLIVEKNNSDQDSEKYQTVKSKAISILEKIEPVRGLEWAKSLHRRGDFEASLRLAEKVTPFFSNTSQSSALFWILGRSSQFLGNYEKAQKYFENYLDQNSGSEEVAEVLFRLGLVHYRQKHDSSVVAIYERLLNSKNSDKYELSARYWLIRALQNLKNERTSLEIQNLLQKFPLSYYGLKLQAERDLNKITWPANLVVTPALATSFYLSQYQKDQLDRIDKLANGGWYLEAHKELADFNFPKIPELKILMAQKLYQSKSFPIIIKLSNEAGEQNPALRFLDIIALTFPQEYSRQISKESARQGLSPLLIKSLIRQESAFGVLATSTSNALGLMQLIPPTAIEVSQELKMGKIQLPDDVYDPETNIQMGTYYISKMIRQFGGNVPLGLAAYNAGPQRVTAFVKARAEMKKLIGNTSSETENEIWFDELPWAETSFYVKAILRNSMIYRTLELKEWTLGTSVWGDLVQSPAENKQH